MNIRRGLSRFAMPFIAMNDDGERWYINANIVRDILTPDVSTYMPRYFDDFSASDG